VPLQPGEDVDLTIEKPAAGGRMLARHGGEVVLVSGTIPGERVRARIERVSRGVAYAIARDILQVDASRRGPAEERPCGGMVYAHIAYARQLQLKAAILADAFTRIARLPLERPIHVEPSPEQGYRMRARLHPRGGRFGFFREGTHELCDPGSTGQLLEETNEVVGRLSAAMRESASVGPAAVDLAENMPASERVLHLDFEGLVTSRDVEWAEVDGVTGATFGGGRRNATTLFGRPSVTDVVEFPVGEKRVAVTFARRADAFFQANRYLLPVLLARATAQVGPGSVVDLYAGVGLFSLALAAGGRDAIVAVEGDPTSADDLRRNARRHGAAVATHAMPVERFLAGRRLAPDATIIVDPPRTGMTRAAMDGVLAQRAARVVYVSCDVATLARDAGRLAAAGYTLEHVEAFDLFPNTAHVEGLVVFGR
jgi:23S rRNA (uracil1939-C5)-methyltransferase